ncbi:hypothetical protein SAMD00019534_008880 [Acytostelium subglobosum LB1]|uniref:hypothetical protein n=1 Tax=Acytostelium subglobosum LB1 TaxID=1410327 RepID=UPI000644D916|nr:hypothetical protein SAMD00019534_008880 [Acytostelium subglobosum LB1]GAM17713.1 hypothetical protein SAMD00019534_008880 [Acytostelium subglobosum LB1]|eukprot:XP_012758309.1 hypothetical protein SAMD00019534_008880 [Acytostelium subglobosum LB1]
MSSSGEQRNEYRVQDSAFIVSLVINAVISLIVFFAFCFIRRRYKNFYQYRYERSHPGVDTPPSDSFFGWIPSTLMYENEKLITHAGLDGFFYLRQLKTHFWICFILMIVTAVGLYPTNAQGTFNDSRKPDETEVVGLATVSMSNIARGSRLLWVHWVFTLIVPLVVCAFIFRDYREYTRRRIHFKSESRLLNYSIYFKDIPKRLFNKDEFYHYLDRFYPGQVKDVTLISQKMPIYKDMNKREKFINKYEAAMETTARKNKTQYTKDGFLGLVGQKREKMEFFQENITNFDKGIETKRASYEENMPGHRCGFAVFNHRSNAKITLQTIMDKKYPYKMVTYPAPDPYDVYWKNAGISYKSFLQRTLVVSIFIFFLVFFWMVPITFISGFSNIATLQKVKIFDWLIDLINKSTILAGFLQGFLPSLIMIIFMAILVPIIKLASRLQGYHAHSLIDKSVLRKYFIFQVVNVFLISAIAGSIFQSIESIVDNPSSVITMLASSLPGQAFQMINLIMISACKPVFNLLRIFPLIIMFIKLKFFAKTPRKIARVHHQGGFGYATSYAIDLLYFQILLAYSTMTPFILIVGTWYFGLSYLVAKYNIVWVNTPDYQSGGSLFGLCFRLQIVGLVIYLLLMIGVFNLYKFFYGNLTIIPLVLVLLFALYTESMYKKKAQYGVLDTQDAIDQGQQHPVFYDKCISFQEYTNHYQPPFYREMMSIQYPNNEQSTASGPSRT